jgi:glutamate/tyrosine decarboxylase-like PLP-dependent enzyme
VDRPLDRALTMSERGPLDAGDALAMRRFGDDTERAAARPLDAAPHLELVMRPQLSVVLFRRRGWSPDDYQRWSDAALEQEFAFFVPTVHGGESVFRFCLVNPTTTVDDIEAILAAMAD